MKIAIPVKTDKENPAVSPLFGKAKWFAFIEDGKISIEKNEAGNGQAVIKWFNSKNIDTIIFMEMGASPYETIRANGDITLYHTGYERILLDEVLQKLKDQTLATVDHSKMEEIIIQHKKNH